MPGYRQSRRRPAPADRGPAGGATANRASAGGSAADASRRDAARRANLPRRTAYDVLAAVHNREAYANLLLPRLLAERGISGRDAAFATELAYGTLRGQGTYDAVLAACSDRPLDRLDPPVRHVLRLGAHQLLATRVGAHAAVSTSVDLARAVVGQRACGYVNAVLRRIATRNLDAWLEIVAPSLVTDEDGYLAIRYSHPRWIVAAYRAALGDQADAPVVPEALASPSAASVPNAPGVPSAPSVPDVLNVPSVPGSPGTGKSGEASPAGLTELEAALAAGNARPRVMLATFPGGPPRDQVMPEDAVPGRWSPYAFALHGGDPAPLVETGLAAVQDEGSQLAAIALARAPLAGGTGDARAERWLDMCAGPGGKARLLAGLAGEASLIAADIYPHRAALIRQALALAPTSAAACGGRAVVVADGTRPPWADGAFDRVLVDAPCSGLGALRRRPEARWRKSPAEIPALARLQRDLLRHALAAVRPGGVVAYVTCSPLPTETRDVVTEVASATADVEILDAQAVLPDVPGAGATNPLFVQLWPHRHGTDAMFIALLRRGGR